MMNLSKFAGSMIILASALSLVACQVMTETQCQSANWALLGSQDGERGYSSRFGERMESCAKHGITLQQRDQQQYQMTYQQGIQRYCQPDNIYRLALNGQGSIHACPTLLYQRLKPLHDSATRVYENQQEIESYRKQLKDIDNDSKMSAKDKYAESKRIHETLDRLLRYQRLLQEDLDRHRP